MMTLKAHIPTNGQYGFKAIKSKVWENMERGPVDALWERSARQFLAVVYMTVPGGVIDSVANLLGYAPTEIHERLLTAMRRIKDEETGGADELLLDIIEHSHLGPL